MAQLKKSEVDKMVREAGEVLLDTTELTQVAGNIWIGKTEVDGYERFFEVKIVAKKIGYSQDDVDALLNERAEVEARKQAAKTASAKKAEKDKARREKAKADKEKTE